MSENAKASGTDSGFQRDRLHWSAINVWRENDRGGRYKVNSRTERANVLLRFRDERTMPDGYHLFGFKVVHSMAGMESWSDAHTYVHAYTLNLYFDDGSAEGPKEIHDAREVSTIADALASGKWLPGVQPWRKSVEWGGIEAESKGATATIGEHVKSKRNRFA